MVDSETTPPRRPGADQERWLKARIAATAGPTIRRAMLLGALASALVVPQAWLLAHAIAPVVMEAAPIGPAFVWLALALPLLLLRFALARASDRAALAAAARLKANARAALLHHLAALGPARLAGRATGDIATVVIEGVDALEPYVARYLSHMGTLASLPLLILAAVLPLDWISGLILLATAPIIPLFMFLLGQRAEEMNRRQWQRLARLSGQLLDGLQRLTTLRMLNAEVREEQRLARAAEAFRASTMSVLRVAFLSSLALEFFATVSIAVTAVLIGFRLLWGEVAFVDGLTVLLLAPLFYAPLRTLGTERHARMEAVAAAERLADFLARPVPERSVGEPFAASGAVSVRFDNVSASYGGERLALDGVSFEIRPGEQVAIVGESGAGKSTILSLIAGFLEPVAGTIFIDGRPLASLDLADVRRHIAFLPQRAFLFDASISENVAMGRSGDVGVALRAARADEFVNRLPNGADSRLGEGGAGLSGGEAQRLMLARALFAPAPLVLMDEPTAHLDAATESAVGEAIAALSVGRTRLTIAHRLKTVEAADRVLVLSGGRLVEEGRPDELKARGGAFAAMLATLDVGGPA